MDCNLNICLSKPLVKIRIFNACYLFYHNLEYIHSYCYYNKTLHVNSEKPIKPSVFTELYFQ